MAIYITQGNYSEHAAKGIVDHPADWMNAMTGCLKSVGVALLEHDITNHQTVRH